MTETSETPIDTLRLFRVVCKQEAILEHYIGFTTCLLEYKLKHFKSEYINPMSSSYNNKLNNFIREHGGWENWQLQLIDEYEWQTKSQAKQKQIELVKSSPWATLNHEYHTQTKEKQLERRRERDRLYQYNNRFTIAEKRNQKCKCDVCGSAYTLWNKSKHLLSQKHHLALKNNDNVK